MTSILLTSVTAGYDAGAVLHDVSASVGPGGWLGLIGPNGAGKTTLLRAIAGLIRHEGEIVLGERPATGITRRGLARLVAFVPQRPVVPPSMAVTDYVLMGRTPYIPYLGVEGGRDVEVVAEVIERLDLGPLAARPLGSLSGGEVQRAVLARALAQKAPVLLLDEPTATLDVGNQQRVLELIDELRLEHDLTVVGAMHDLTLAGQFADELLLLDGGRTAAFGPARSVLTERVIRRHYGASVRVEEDADGRILVIPTRPRSVRAVSAGAQARPGGAPSR